ncbi:MAG: hypothetical protein AB8G17_05360 [Gammaproteobacteria bacterium]
MYLISKIALCLVLAFGFGFALAWFAWRAHAQRREDDLTSRWEQRLGDMQRQTDTKLAKLRHEVDESRQQIPTLEASLADRSDLISTLEADLLEWRERFGQVEAQIKLRDEQIAQLEQSHDAAAEQLTELQGKLAKREESPADAAEPSTQQRAQMEKSVRRAQEAQRRAEARVNALDTELDTLHGTLDKVSAKCERALADLEQARAANVQSAGADASAQQLHAMTQRAQQQSETIAKHANAVRLFEQERTVLRDANAQLKERVATQEEKIGALSNQVRSGQSAPRPEGVRPESLLDSAPTERPADDLKKIRGIGPVLERTLNELGIYFFAQVSNLSSKEIEWVANHINTFPGRIARDKWVEQASELDGR